MAKLQVPAEAMPAVKEIRARIPRPRNLPSLWTTRLGKLPPLWTTRLRWTHPISKAPCCPLGLHPESVNRPDATSITGRPDLDVPCKTFWRWWDSQQDPQAAVDAVWGKAKK